MCPERQQGLWLEPLGVRRSVRGRSDIHQYRERKESERKSPGGLLLAGTVYLVLSLAALAVYEFL